jgi:lysophospholipase L1-like esterase
MKVKGIKIQRSWLLIAFASVFSSILLLIGAGLAYTRSLEPGTPASTSSPVHNNGQQRQPANLQHSGHFRIVAMGDSLTRGYGDDSGLGYIGNLQQDLQARGQTVTVENVAVNGYVSSQLANQLKQDVSLQKSIASADLIAFSIGGNDLVRTVNNFTIPTLEQTMPAQQTYLHNLEFILKTIRANNPHAPILMVGLYNPFLQFQGGSQGTAIVEDWNAQTSALLRSFPNAMLVPTLDLFTANQNSFLYEDHFHPNADGYKAIAQRMLQDIPQS